jgi:hypothetical protein
LFAVHTGTKKDFVKKCENLWIHANSRKFTRIHVNSRKFTWIHAKKCEISWIHAKKCEFGSTVNKRKHKQKNEKQQVMLFTLFFTIYHIYLQSRWF